jgi:hypothetical protein
MTTSVIPLCLDRQHRLDDLPFSHCEGGIPGNGREQAQVIDPACYCLATRS